MYAYVGNNPVVIIDPSGLCGETPVWYDPWLAGPIGVIGDAAGYIHEIPGLIISVALGAEFDRRQRAELSDAFYAGERAGAQIAANEYTFGGTDALGLTSASEKVSEYNKYEILGFGSGSASKFLGARSRDAAIAAASLKGFEKATGIRFELHGTHGEGLPHIQAIRGYPGNYWGDTLGRFPPH